MLLIGFISYWIKSLQNNMLWCNWIMIEVSYHIWSIITNQFNFHIIISISNTSYKYIYKNLKKINLKTQVSNGSGHLWHVCAMPMPSPWAENIITAQPTDGLCCAYVPNCSGLCLYKHNRLHGPLTMSVFYYIGLRFIA